MKSLRSKVAGMSLLLLATFALGYCVSRARAAGIPATGALTYSGILTNSDGTFVTGSQNLLIQLYTVATAGSAACASPATAVTLAAGAFQVPLGDDCTALVHANTDLWVDVLVNGASVGRSKLGAVPYAVEADHAQTATTATTATTAVTATALAAGPISGALTFASVAGSAITASSTPCAAVSGAIVDCTCPTGSFVVSGGGYGAAAGVFLRESEPTNTTHWRVTCANATADTLCGAYFLVCSRVGP